jgi:hypothetical protein
MIVNVSPFRSESGFKSPGFLVTPTGDLILDGSLQASNLTIDSLSANEILIQGISVFDFEDSAVSLSSSVTQSSLTRFGIIEFLELQGDVDFRNIDGDQVLRIQNGQVLLTSTELGSIDNVVIGENAPADGYFENIEALNLTVSETVDSQQVNTIVVNAETVNTSVLTSTSIEADNVLINLQPTEINHATRKDYVDTTAAALAIALGA